MNILRWNRKSKNKIKPKTLLLLIFSLIMTTFAWFAYSKVIQPTLNIHMASWDMEYYIGDVKKTNPIAIEIPTLYPTMPEQTVTIDIFNNGETLVDIEYQVKSVTIAGTSYEIVPEGGTNTTANYIALAQPVLETITTTITETPEEEVTEENADAAEADTEEESTTTEITEQIYKGVITNDITKFPFTVEIEHSAQVEAVTEDEYGTKIPGQGYLKVTVNWIGDNNILDSEWGYKVGEYLANNPTATSAMSIVLSVDSYQVDPDAEEIEETLPSTTETKPFLPEGFTRVPGTNLSTGLVIKDNNGNEYVWVEVPKSATIYTTAGISITEFDDTKYGLIETDLRNYVSAYSTRADVHTDYSITGLSDSNYKTFKQKMLKTIYTNGGFYIGRYETGIASGYRTAEGTASQTPVIKPNVYPYNYVTCSQANTLAQKLAPTGYTTSLMFGLQWDLVMKYLETKGTSQDMLKTDSTLWGNYANNSYSLTNKNAKYMTNTEWLSTIPYEKDWNEQVLITSGGNSGMCRQNIYDLAGNLSEWTYNVILSNTTYIGGNGGDYLSDGTNATANYYGTYDTLSGLKQVGFRVTLY